jgi:hypothetical protein
MRGKLFILPFNAVLGAGLGACSWNSARFGQAAGRLQSTSHCRAVLSSRPLRRAPFDAVATVCFMWVLCLAVIGARSPGFGFGLDDLLFGSAIVAAGCALWLLLALWGLCRHVVCPPCLAICGAIIRRTRSLWSSMAHLSDLLKRRGRRAPYTYPREPGSRLPLSSWWPVSRCPSEAGFGCPPRSTVQTRLARAACLTLPCISRILVLTAMWSVPGSVDRQDWRGSAER